MDLAMDDVVVSSQKGYHSNSDWGPPLPVSILVGPTALHSVLRAVGSTRMCHDHVTGGTLPAGILVPTRGVTDKRSFSESSSLDLHGPKSSSLNITKYNVSASPSGRSSQSSPQRASSETPCFWQSS